MKRLTLAAFACLWSLSAQALPAGWSDQAPVGLTVTYVETPAVTGTQTNVTVTVQNSSGGALGYNLFLGASSAVTVGNSYTVQVMVSKVSSGPRFGVGYHLYNASDVYLSESDTNFLTIVHSPTSASLPGPDIAVSYLAHKYTVAAGVGKIQPRIAINGIPAGATMSFNVVSTMSGLASSSGAGGGGGSPSACGTFGTQAATAPGGATILNTTDNIASIVNAAAAGTTFFFNAGTYRGVNLTPKNNQVFLGAPGAILNGSNLLTGWTASGADFYVTGQTQEGQRLQTGAGYPGSVNAGYPDTVYYDDVPLRPVASQGALATGKFFFDYAADRIYIRDNPSGHKVEAGVQSRAIGGNATGVTVKNLTIEKYATPTQAGAIDGLAANWVAQNNELRLNYALGVRLYTGGQILGNYVHDNGQMGLGGFGNDTGSLLVENNEIARNGDWSGIDAFWEGGGMKIANTDSLVIRGNYSHDNYGWGLWTDINNINTLYENNVLMRNTGGGLSHEISYAATIRNNIFIKNGGLTQGWNFGGAINIQNSQNVQVYGNKIDATGSTTPAGKSCQMASPCTGNTINMIQQNRGTGNHGTYQVRTNNVHDNTIMSKDAAGVTGNVGGAADFDNAGMVAGGNVWTNNTYYMPDGNRFWWNNSITNFNSFKTATGENGTISQSYPDSATWTTCP